MHLATLLFHLGVWTVGPRHLDREGGCYLQLLFLLPEKPRDPQPALPGRLGAGPWPPCPHHCFEPWLRCSPAHPACPDLWGVATAAPRFGYISSATQDLCSSLPFQPAVPQGPSGHRDRLPRGLRSLCSISSRMPGHRCRVLSELAPERPLQPRGSHRTCPAHREPPAPLPAASGTAPEGKGPDLSLIHI